MMHGNGGATDEERVSPELAAIGQRLRAARELRHLTLEDVEAATHVRRAYLEAIEGGRADLLPGEVFLKGFVRIYADHLGLDGEGLVEEYKRAVRQRLEAVAEGPSRRKQRRRSRARSGGQGAAALVLVAAVVAAVLASVGARHHPRHGPASPAVGQPPRGEAIPSAAPPAPSSSSRSGPTSPGPTQPEVQVSFTHTAGTWHGTYLVRGASQLTVTISVQAPCWTRRWVDTDEHGPYTDATLGTAGAETVTWTARRSLILWLGNQPAITAITVNGRPTQPLPPQGADPSEWLLFQLAG